MGDDGNPSGGPEGKWLSQGRQSSSSKAKRHSVAIRDLELAVPVAAVHDEGTSIGLLDQSCINELAHEIGGRITLGLLLLEHLDLRLHGLILGESGSILLLLQLSGFFLIADLGLGASSFTAHFQHVGRYTLG